MKIIVAHEGKQHSFMTAEYLHKEGLLFKYITTVYDKPFSITRIVKHLLRGGLRKRSEARRSALPDNKVKQFLEWRGIFLLMILRSPKLKTIFPNYWDSLHDDFGKAVAKYAIRENVDAVIMYDSNCTVCWEYLKEKAPHIKRIMDVSIANRLYMKETYKKDIENTGELAIKEEQKFLWDEYNMQRILQEVKDSHYFLVGSTMVKKSLIFCGVKDEQIYHVTYGVDSSKFEYVQKASGTQPLKLIYVGQVNYRKGMHHLLKVVSQFNKNQIVLNIVGSVSNSNKFYQKYKDCDNINFLGYLTRDILAQEYQKADVFVLCSLGEGCALVALEALSCGLPCILSDMTGSNDLIENYKNGIVFQVGDDEALRNAIQWFINNPDMLPIMSAESRDVALAHSWDVYGEKLVKAIKHIMK